jgi:hypothetical protein
VKILQSALGRAVGAIPNQFVLELIARKLAAEGINLSDRDRKRLVKRLATGSVGTFRVGSLRFWDRRKIKLEFTAEDVDQAGKKFTEFIEVRLPQVIVACADDLSQKILADLKGKMAFRITSAGAAKGRIFEEASRPVGDTDRRPQNAAHHFSRIWRSRE